MGRQHTNAPYDNPCLRFYAGDSDDSVNPGYTAERPVEWPDEKLEICVPPGLPKMSQTLSY